ncbi:MAG: GntR family transcriptional regulator [Steroidobacteraceae bacterium]
MTEGAVYERIKNWLLAQALVPGQLLQIGVLADELGVSTTPVREALTRLAAERLIMSVPKRGFFARTPSEDDILGLYCVTHTILDAAVARCARQAENGGKQPEDAPILVDLKDPSAEQLVRRTAELFLEITSRSGVAEYGDIIRNMNDRLRHARVMECEIISNVREELATLSELFASQKHQQLRQALRAYQEQRLSAITAIAKELLLRPFTTAEW